MVVGSEISDAGANGRRKQRKSGGYVKRGTCRSEQGAVLRITKTMPRLGDSFGRVLPVCKYAVGTTRLPFHFDLLRAVDAQKLRIIRSLTDVALGRDRAGIVGDFGVVGGLYRLGGLGRNGGFGRFG